ncbi:hypothetical protein LCGC14_1493340 [marine sediment metagenome]|uniref:Uncharacterized protein n=1 Tax=marine sediment metagenome TaxID=412755 RepID=A0A0F9LLM5_9ZZZZ
MSKVMLSLFGAALIFILHLATMMWGWGLEVTSWGWVIGGWAASAIVVILMETAKEVDK